MTATAPSWAKNIPGPLVCRSTKPGQRCSRQLRPLHEALLSGKRGAFFAEDLLLRIQRHGHEWEDARFTISYSPIPDATAPTGVGGVLITCVETTNRVLMEEALRASQERFSGIFHQTSVGVVQCALDGRFEQINGRFCQITERTESELLSLGVADVTHPDDRQDTMARLNRLVTDGVPFRFGQTLSKTRWLGCLGQQQCCLDARH